MNNSSNKRVRSKWISIILIVVTGLFLFSQIFPIGQSSFLMEIGMEIFNPIQRLIHKGTDKFDEKISSINSKNTMEANNFDQEIASLKKELIEAKLNAKDLKELTELKETLHFISDQGTFSYVSTDIISKNEGNFYDIFTISVGTKHGVKVNDLVVDGDGMVGIIYQVSPHYAKVLSLMSGTISVSFQLLDHLSVTGIVRENSSLNQMDTQEGYLYGYLFEDNDQIMKNETVITSGLGVFPRGIPIGKVEDIIRDDTKLMTYIKIKPVVQFQNVSKVTVISSRENINEEKLYEAP